MSYRSIWIARRAEILDAAEQMKVLDPAAWAEVTVPGQVSRRFISLVAAQCQRAVNDTIGCNLKRGGPDVSLDVLAMPNPSGARDATGTFSGLELIDIIKDAEGPDAKIAWGDVTQKTIDAGVPGGWIKTGIVAPVPVPQPSLPPYPGDLVFDQIGVALFADYAEANTLRPNDPNTLPNAGMGRWFGRTTFDYLAGMPIAESIKKHRNGPGEWREALGLPPL